MAEEKEKQWFYLSMGHRRGPVTYEELCEKIIKQDLFLDTTKIWQPGMEQWASPVDVKQFAPAVKKLREKAAKEDARVRETVALKGVDEDILCRGATRALFNAYFYVGWLLPLLIGVVALAELQVQQWLEPSTVHSSLFLQWLPFLLVALAFLEIAAVRLSHAGYSKLRCLGLFVPIYNFWVLFLCLFAPRNFKRKKKLGAAAVGYILLFAVAISGSLLFYLPKVGLSGISPIAITEKVTDIYKEKTHFHTRYKKNADKASRVDSHRKVMEENKAKQEHKSMRERRGLQ